MFKNMKIGAKLILSMLLIGLLPMLIMTVISIMNSSSSLQHQASNQLNAIKTIKKQQIVKYFEDCKNDLITYTDNSAVRQASERFIRAFNEEGGLNGPEWTKWNQFHGPKFEGYIETYGYYDLFIISNNGKVVYTAAKEGDIGKDLKNGALKDSPLGKAYREGLTEFAFIDYEWYDISNEPAAFIAKPVYDLENNKIGVFAFQLSLKNINNIMQERTGMGKTGETYLVGSDLKMRSDSYLDPEGHSVKASFAGTVKENGVDTEASKEAMAGNENTKIIQDYNGNPVLSSFAPVNILGKDWAIIAEIDEAEIEEPIDALMYTLIVIMIIISVIVTIVAIFLSRSINKGIKKVLDQLSNLVKKVVDGKLDSRGNPEDVGIDFKEVVVNLNNLIDAFVAPINVTAEYVDRISKGDIPPEITDEYKGDFNEIKNNLNVCINAINALVADAKMLAGAAAEGKLDTRADASKHGGDFRAIVEGVNGTLDNVIGPLNVAAEYVDRISKGDIPPEITDEYKGDFNEIKNNLNQCIDMLNLLIDEMRHMSAEHDAGDIDIVIDADKFQGAYQTMAKGVNDMVNGHISVKKKAMACFKEFGKGNFDAEIEQFPGKKAFINETIEGVRQNLKGIASDMNTLIQATKDGKLDTRGDTSSYEGDWSKLVGDVNELIDAFVGPINVTAEYVDRISKGDIPPKIEDEYKGDFNEIKNNLNHCIDMLNLLIDEMRHMSAEHDAGDIDVAIDADKFQGAYQTMATGVNDMVNGHISVKKKAMACFKEFGKGNFDAEIEQFPGKKAFINETIEGVRQNLKGIASDMITLIQATKDGKLDTRGDASSYEGGWAKLVGDVNELIDAFVGPINVTAEYVDRISKGDIPPEITDEYKGDFNEIKNNLNVCINAINALVADAKMLAGAAAEGKLDTRADASKHGGDFRAIVEGVNGTLDNVIGPLNVAAEYVDRISKGDIPPEITDEYKGDFNEIKNNLNTCIDAINALVGDAKMLAGAAAEGKLDTRADASKHGGDFRAIVEGVNGTLDNVIGPLNVAAEYVDRISKGDIPPEITDEYKGDFNEIKNNLNVCINAINQLVADAAMLADAGMHGKLRTRADADKHGGDFRKIVAGVNNTLDAVVGLIDGLPIPAMAIDKDYNIVYMNETGAGLDGKTGEQIEGMKCYDHFKTSDCKTNNCACHQAMNSKNIANSETDAHPNGHDLEINYSGIPILDEQGNSIGAFEVVMDQTEIKNQLRKNEKIANYQNAETNKLVGALEKLARGEFSTHIEFEDPDDDTQEVYTTLERILTATRKFTQAVFALQDEINTLADAALEGQLDKRADLAKHEGDFRKIVEGLNEMLNQMIEPINEATDIISVLGTGDLTARIVSNYKGDHQKLKQGLNALADSLSNVLIQVGESAQNVASAAVETSSTAEEMATAAQEQSSQADEVASAVEEMSRTVTENAMAAGKTAENAQKNKDVAEEGGTVVEQTINKMKDIAEVVKLSAENIKKLGDSSKSIGEIISVIDDIADQTNLLALNAAIEAARAGEQGRGFAVVADEVRKLAERTTEATKQIATMIKGIQGETEEAVLAMEQGNTEVDNGIQLADKAGNALRQVVISSQDVLDMINQIAAASEEQSSTSEQISQNVLAISKVTNESARRIEDIAHSSEDMTKLTENLMHLMEQFKIDENSSTMLEGADMKSIGSMETKKLQEANN